MDICALKHALWQRGLSIPKLAERMGVSKKLMYSRFKGETAFKQTEICVMKEILGLTEQSVVSIFLSDVCPKGNKET